LLEGYAVGEVKTKTFSNKVDDEASNLKLTLDLNVSSLAVKKESVYEAVKVLIQGKVPGGFVLRNEQLTLTFELVKDTKGVYEFEVNVVANLLPSFNPTDIAAKISGKSISLAKDYLKSMSGFSRAEIRIRPSLPIITGNLPHLTKNIEVEVVAER